MTEGHRFPTLRPVNPLALTSRANLVSVLPPSMRQQPDDRRFHLDVQLEQRLAAYNQAAEALPWVRAQLGGQLSIALCERGWLRDGARQAEIAWDHALNGQ